MVRPAQDDYWRQAGGASTERLLDDKLDCSAQQNRSLRLYAVKEPGAIRVDIELTGQWVPQY